MNLAANFIKRFERGSVLEVSAVLDFQAGNITVLFGASGAGKTTVLRCLAGLECPEQGSIHFGETAWYDAAKNVFVPARKRRAGFVPQDFALFPHLTVERNIAYGLNACGWREQRRKVAEVANWLGLGDLVKRMPSELSGGQQQRVALARAVVWRPQLLLLDEPFSALDAPTRVRLRTELRRILVELKIPTVLVTHDRGEALALGDDLMIMDGGRVVQHGPIKEVFNRPATLSAASILAVETILPGHVLGSADGMVLVNAEGTTFTSFTDQTLTPDSEVYVCIRGEDVILARDAEVKSSARNRIPGVIRALQQEGPLVRIELDCGFRLFALLTRQACAELQLLEGARVLAMVKAPHVHLIPRPDLRSGQEIG